VAKAANRSSTLAGNKEQAAHNNTAADSSIVGSSTAEDSRDRSSIRPSKRPAAQRRKDTLLACRVALDGRWAVSVKRWERDHLDPIGAVKLALAPNGLSTAMISAQRRIANKSRQDLPVD